MSRRLDHEFVNKVERSLEKGRDFAADPAALSDKEQIALQDGVEKTRRKAANAVDKIRLRANDLKPSNPRQQIAYLDHLFRQLSPRHKRSKDYGLFIKKLIDDLKRDSFKRLPNRASGSANRIGESEK
ncbi:hypothetical protein [Rhodosalinus halophilus]|uniref:hypothetical protein n=1 Tax=Rhodosalinus halophilus TaxID=2259333 RepID=UPI0011BF2B6B|nr:hypothetical protein [Rhodosalinus halophilus]